MTVEKQKGGCLTDGGSNPRSSGRNRTDKVCALARCTTAAPTGFLLFGLARPGGAVRGVARRPRGTGPRRDPVSSFPCSLRVTGPGRAFHVCAGPGLAQGDLRVFRSTTRRIKTSQNNSGHLLKRHLGWCAWAGKSV
ncbi:hypothetical protein SKAU_G00373900 [Synaphobranchus kaupii]|uniref:Uncharacterized protein n=1 Tax=Synaphobranchus kaupii TaxID=118154 RepID=A0A9Q1EGM1_SYNKA|nr:hypothetical protein SKAU_G00373900 [Synaphobranchus kaupii]